MRAYFHTLVYWINVQARLLIFENFPACTALFSLHVYHIPKNLVLKQLCLHVYFIPARLFFLSFWSSLHFYSVRTFIQNTRVVDGSVRVVQALFWRIQIVSVEGQMVRPDQGHSQVKLLVDIGPRGLHFCETQVFPTHRSDSNILVGGKWPNNVRLSHKILSWPASWFCKS